MQGKGKPAARQPEAYRVGMEVEVLCGGKGRDGTVFPDVLPAVIDSIDESIDKCTVTFVHDSFEGLCKVRDLKDICRKPPETPAGFAKILMQDDIVQHFDQGGWWKVRIKSVGNLLQAACATDHKLATSCRAQNVSPFCAPCRITCS